VVWDDKTTFSDPAPEVTTFGIITPTGTVVKTNTLVDPRAIWDNVCAYHGGFAVRVQDTIYFYDNNGNLQGSSPQDSSGLSFDKGRGDGTRIASDIRSYYVYLAGNAGAHTPVSVAIWDSRTRKFVASAPVSDTDPSIHVASRVVVAVDASDRFCVAYGLQPNGNFSQEQVAARVMSFDGTNITYLTHSFFPFVNYDADGSLGDAVTDINALRMRTQEGFPNFGEVDDVANFEQIQRGLAAPEDEWVYMNRGLGIPDRIKTGADGSITAPATDEAFMREHFKEWKRLMKACPNLAIRREP